MEREQIIEADLTWVEGGFEPNVQVVVGGGRIQQVGFLDRRPTLRLEDRALLPGMINAHSHAFQRGLRGFGEYFTTAASTAESWRMARDELVEDLEAEEFNNLTRMAFSEMIHHGITSVGEFHYFHHALGRRDFAFDQLVLQAAADAGIRLVLLCCFIARGGIDAPLTNAQQRFGTPDVDEFLAQVDRLRAQVDGEQQRIGLAVQSMEAATPDEVATLARYAEEHRLVLHIRAEELSSDVAACRAAYGKSPVEILLERGLLSSRTTLIHCSHTPAETLRAVAATGATVCLCPGTEANLGDPVVDLPALIAANGRVCLGTDSNVRVSMNEEMRWLEYTQRAHRGQRGIYVDRQGRTADALWRCATRSGATALDLPAGCIAPGNYADFAVIDMQGLSLLGATPESLLAGFVFGADRACITHTCIGGVWRLLGE